MKLNFSHFIYGWDFSCWGLFFHWCLRVLFAFSPVASMQSFIVIMSWFVLTVMLEDFLCTRAKRPETNRYVSKFWLQIAVSKTFNFWAVGLWEKLGFLWLKELLVHSSDTEFIHDAMFYWVISKAGHITVTYCILPNSLGAVVMFCLY